MDAQLQVLGGDTTQEVADLWEWLRGERGLAGSVHALRQPVGEQELGGAVDLLAVALGSGGVAGVVLARSLAAWLRTRRPDVKVTVKTKVGTISVDARNVRSGDVLLLLEQVLRDADV